VSRGSRAALFGAILVGAVVLTSCGGGSGDVARLPDCIDCRPVEMTIDQTLEIELGSDRAVTNDPDAYEWVTVDTGAMTLISEVRGTRSEDPQEFVGGYSRYVVFSFEATEAGTTQMRFDFVAPGDAGGEPMSSLDVTVVVSP
jgi:hypothetical protein